MVEAGQLLENRYLIQKQIGAGGMGTVYVATDQRLHSFVAIKKTLFDDVDLQKAFEREAHLLNSLRHSALPRVIDYFTAADGQFLVMEYFAGEDLAAILKRKLKFEMTEVLRWADELLDALDYLHNQKTPVIHRDIKPQNLKLTETGEVVLLDFGLAKGNSGETSQLSKMNSVFGYSRSYAPLEQIQGTGTDIRSDLYSWGATIYHLLTGKPPVDALTRASAFVNNEPNPLALASAINAEIPASVAAVLNHALELNAALRPQSAAALREMLQQAVVKPAAAPEIIRPLPTVDAEVTTLDKEKFKARQTALLAATPAPVAVDNQRVLSNPMNVEIPAAQNSFPNLTQTRSGDYTELTVATAKRSSNSLGRSLGIAAAILLLGGGGLAAWYATSQRTASQETTNQNSSAPPIMPKAAVVGGGSANVKTEVKNTAAIPAANVPAIESNSSTAPTTEVRNREVPSKITVNNSKPAQPQPEPVVEKETEKEEQPPIVVKSAPPSANKKDKPRDVEAPKKQDKIEEETAEEPKTDDSEDAPPPANRPPRGDQNRREERRREQQRSPDETDVRERRVQDRRNNRQKLPTLLGAPQK